MCCVNLWKAFLTANSLFVLIAISSKSRLIGLCNQKPLTVVYLGAFRLKGTYFKTFLNKQKPAHYRAG